MINYGDIINQIRTYTTCFKAVSGGISVDSLDVTTNTALPAAFVIPLGFEAQLDVVRTGGLFQRCAEQFGIIVVINTGDLRGQQAAMLIPMMRTALWAAILNWSDMTDDAEAHSVQGIYYVGDEYLHYDSGRVFWLFKYAVDDQLTEADGFQIDYPQLRGIDLNVIVDLTKPEPPVPAEQPDVNVKLYPPNQTNVIDIKPQKPDLSITQ